MLNRDNQLLANIKANLPALRSLLKELHEDWNCEDAVYRYYHHSFKVYYIQSTTEKIVGALCWLHPAPEIGFNDMFERLYVNGTGLRFRWEHNRDWDRWTRPQLEAFFHAKYFLEMCIKYGEKYDIAPQMLDYGWAGLLYLYNMR